MESIARWLSEDDLVFPPVDHALEEPNGLLAVGGDLSPQRLMEAYRLGIFPWYEEPQPILWWSPNPRAILIPNEVYVAKSLAKKMRRGEHEVRVDTAFDAVIDGCARTEGTWITDDMREAYIALHMLGHAHSIEVWRDGNLVGGLYGVARGKVFFGESMFSREPDASKIALVTLAKQLEEWGFVLIDCQVGSDHLYSMGAKDMPRDLFGAVLAKYTELSDGSPIGKWSFTP